ncbi:MAG TPA: hypothetical protein VIJ85_09790 [Rhizomicrobium sp.]
MRVFALGLCGTVAIFLTAGAANAAPSQTAHPPDYAERSTPASTNDHDGAFIPKAGSDRGFTINPDGDAAQANYAPDADQDQDGSDEEIYQGEDDQLPA